jgi:hypothetical protein
MQVDSDKTRRERISQINDRLPLLQSEHDVLIVEPASLQDESITPVERKLSTTHKLALFQVLK